MTKAEHIKIHKRLHGSLDELVGDFLYQNEGSLSTTSIMKLMEWAATQIINPCNAEAVEVIG